MNEYEQYFASLDIIFIKTLIYVYLLVKANKTDYFSIKKKHEWKHAQHIPICLNRSQVFCFDLMKWLLARLQKLISAVWEADAFLHNEDPIHGPLIPLEFIVLWCLKSSRGTPIWVNVKPRDASLSADNYSFSCLGFRRTCDHVTLKSCTEHDSFKLVIDILVSWHIFKSIFKKIVFLSPGYILW